MEHEAARQMFWYLLVKTLGKYPDDLNEKYENDFCCKITSQYL